MRTTLILGTAAIIIAALAYIGAALAIDRFWVIGSKGTLRVALQSFSAETLDPSLDTADGLRYHGHIYDHLIGTDPEGRLDTDYGLVSAWEVAADASAFTLTLRHNAEWHEGVQVAAELFDGVRVTGYDVSDSLHYYSREGTACGVCGALKDKIEIVEHHVNYDLMVTLHLTDPDVVFLGLLAAVEGDTPLLPQHAIREGPAAFSENPIGSGPWRFASRALGDYVEYEANTDYWDAERVPAFDALRITNVPGEDAINALLQTDMVDVAPIRADTVEEAKRMGYGVDGPKHVVSTTLRFFMSYDPDFLTSSLEFRKALAVSVDMPQIVESIYPSEAASVATGSALFTPVSPGYIADLPGYEYDPQEAQRLLAQSGYAGETVSLLSLVAYGLAEMPRINDMIADYWRDAGVNAEVIATEWPAVQPLFMANPQQFDAYAPAPVLHGAAPTRPGGDINGIRRYMSGADGAMLTYFAPNVGDGMLAQVSLTASDAERAIALKALNRKTYGEYWAIPIMWRHDTYAVNPALTGWQPTNGTSSDLHFETLRPVNTLSPAQCRLAAKVVWWRQCAHSDAWLDRMAHLESHLASHP